MKNVKVALLSSLMLGAPLSDAATESSNLNVSANVVGTCVIDSVGAVNFGDVVVGVTPTDQTGAVFTTCTDGLTYRLTMSAGANATGDQRYMVTAGGSKIPYGIYKDAMKTNAWGDAGFGDTNTFTPVTRVGTGVSHGYGWFVAANPNATDTTELGSHTDVVVVTAHF